MLNVLGHVYIHYCLRGAAVLSFATTVILCFPELSVNRCESWSPHLTYFFLPSIQTCI